VQLSNGKHIKKRQKLESSVPSTMINLDLKPKPIAPQTMIDIEANFSLGAKMEE
jgi:hypothetical protein